MRSARVGVESIAQAIGVIGPPSPANVIGALVA
jgi:hypothetical protein